MLKCRDIADHSSDYLDSNLSLNRRLSIRFHLVMCGHCRRYLRYLHAVTEALSKIDQHVAHETQIEKIMARIDAERE